MTIDRAMPKAELGKSDRFYANPILRDEEWSRATQPPWLLMIGVVAIVGVGFFFGVYGDEPYSTVGWTVGGLAILICLGIGCSGAAGRGVASAASTAIHRPDRTAGGPKGRRCFEKVPLQRLAAVRVRSTSRPESPIVRSTAITRR